ncbi:MAG TPA: amidohydrolase family protein [Bryobacteraceae bacterium]|nr:amidohydrolase family protein [Bryobacteraceae bacterium]
MPGTLLVRGARQLLTLHGAGDPRRGSALQELGIIRDGALLIEDGRIIEVGTSRRVENLALAHRSQEIDATGCVVMPGFVDCHTQLVWGARGLDAYEASVPEAAAALRNSSGKRLESQTRRFIHSMVRHGTTSLGAEVGSETDLRTGLKLLRVHARLHRAPVDIGSTFVASSSAVEKPSDVLTPIHRRGLARFASVRCDERTADVEQCRSYLEAARRLGFELKVHAGPGQASRAVGLAVRMGAISVEQLREAGADDVERLASSNTIAVLLPGSTVHYGSFARRLIEGGAALALGTGFDPRTNSSYNMQTIVALACENLGMHPAEAICAATFNAACAIGLGHIAGSLEAGKPADLIVLNTADYREIPRRTGVNLVQCVVKRGVTIYREGKVAR